jgi:hypothetical protein
VPIWSKHVGDSRFWQTQRIDETKIFTSFQDLYENLRKALHDEPGREIVPWDNPLDRTRGFLLDCKVLIIEYRVYDKDLDLDTHLFHIIRNSKFIEHNVPFSDVEDFMKIEEVVNS